MITIYYPGTSGFVPASGPVPVGPGCGSAPAGNPVCCSLLRAVIEVASQQTEEHFGLKSAGGRGRIVT